MTGRGACAVRPGDERYLDPVEVARCRRRERTAGLVTGGLVVLALILLGVAGGPLEPLTALGALAFGVSLAAAVASLMSLDVLGASTRLQHALVGRDLPRMRRLRDAVDGNDLTALTAKDRADAVRWAQIRLTVVLTTERSRTVLLLGLAVAFAVGLLAGAVTGWQLALACLVVPFLLVPALRSVRERRHLVRFARTHDLGLPS